jgi:microcystin-dependent protein
LIGEQVGQEAVALSVAQLPAHAHAFSTLPGDFNADGTVNAADYVTWRKASGTPAQYAEWRAHFGQSAGAGSMIGATGSASAAAPEPGTIVLVFLALLFVARRRSG